MRCRVCGRELDPQSRRCNKCGTPVNYSHELDNNEFSWNTIDFPKPRMVRDIDMNWGEPRTTLRQAQPASNKQAPVRESAAQAPVPQPSVQPVSQAPAQPVPQPAVQPVPQAPAQPVMPQQTPSVQVQQMPQVQQIPQVNYAMPQQNLAWTMPASTWQMPAQQQVVIPNPYNVTPQQIPSTPVISSMPQMPAQSYPVMPNMSWTIPQGNWTIPPAVIQTSPVQSFVQSQPAAQSVTPQQAPVQLTPSPSTQPAPQTDEGIQSASQTDDDMQSASQVDKNIQSASQTNDEIQQFESSKPHLTLRRRAHAAVSQTDQPALLQDAEPDQADDDQLDFEPFSVKKPIMPIMTKPIDMDEWLDDELKGSDKDEEKFFTFYKKNEDFQKLLDEEYARYKSKYDTDADSLRRSQILSVAEINNAAARAVLIPPVEIPKDPVAVEKPKEETMVFDEFKLEPVKISAPAEDTVSNEDKVYSDFDRMLREGTKSFAEIGEGTLAISNDQLRKEINDLAQRIEEVSSIKPVYAYDKNQRQQKLQEMADARSAFFSDNEEEKDNNMDTQEIKSIFDQWDKERKEAEQKVEKEKKNARVSRVILIVLILIVLFVLVDVCSLKLMPTNNITKFFNNVNTQGVELFNKITGKNVSAKDVTAEELTAQQRAAKNANKNINEITFDVESSKFNSQGEYAFDNLGAMTVVTDEATIVAATEVIVAYNSSWIDYVNEGTDISCFNYLKTDGSAFRAASNFDKLGKTEKYEKLNIGEIRKDANFLYVFTNELIEVTSGTTVSESASNVIYQMTLVGDAYMIVACDNYN